MEADGSPAAGPPVTYLLIDGENLDSTLGVSVLGHRPSPEERPRWERVIQFAAESWGPPVKTLFFLNASSGSLPMPFVQALLAIGARPIGLSGPSTVKVVDVAIQRTLSAIAGRHGNVMLGSHDGDFYPQIAALLDSRRNVAILAFREYLNHRYVDLVKDGLRIFDLEYDAKCFNQMLPRVRIIDITAFDPEPFL